MADMRCWLIDGGIKVPLRTDGTGHLFKFRAVPVHAHGCQDEQSFAREFQIVVEASRSLRHCGEWRTYSDQELLKHLFAFVRENLERNGLPEGTRRNIPLLTTTEKGRFERGSPFSIAAIDPTHPFVVAHTDEDTAMTPDQKRQLRTRFLSQLYEATGGKRTRPADKWDLGKRLGLDRSTTFDICSFLAQEDLLIHNDADHVAITHAGIRHAESGLPVGIDQVGTTSVINAATITGSIIQQAGSHSTQTSQIQNPGIDELRRFMAELRKLIGKVQLPEDRRSDLTAEADTIDAQLRAAKPRWRFVRECLDSIRSVLENAAGNLLGDLLKTFPPIAAWLLASPQSGD